MKVTMQLTVDGLIQALRLKAHGLAEDAEGRYRYRGRVARDKPLPPPRRRDRTGEGQDGSAGD